MEAGEGQAPSSPHTHGRLTLERLHCLGSSGSVLHLSLHLLHLGPRKEVEVWEAGEVCGDSGDIPQSKLGGSFA